MKLWSGANEGPVKWPLSFRPFEDSGSSYSSFFIVTIRNALPQFRFITKAKCVLWFLQSIPPPFYYENFRRTEKVKKHCPVGPRVTPTYSLQAPLHSICFNTDLSICPSSNHSSVHLPVPALSFPVPDATGTMTNNISQPSFSATETQCKLALRRKTFVGL